MSRAVTAERTGLDAPATLLLDPRRLSEVVGRPVRATALRHKPGLSTLAVLLDEADAVLGWVRVATREHWPKLQKAAERAASRAGGERVRLLRPEPELRLAWGPPSTDPRLAAPLRRVRERGLPGADVSLLRYNPCRRAVLRVGARTLPHGVVGPLALRVHAAPTSSTVRAARALADGGLSVLAPLIDTDDPLTRDHSGKTSVWPWLDGPGDLAATGDVATAHAAGAALAALHGRGQGLLPHDLGLPRHDAAALARRRQVVVVALTGLDRELGRWAEGLVARIATPDPGAGPVLLHGDFSADQVHPGDGSGVRLLDPDRLGTGDPRLDLGSFLAWERISGSPDAVGRALLAGYTEAAPGAGWVAPGALAPWVAHALSVRLLEPFRAARADWREATAGRLDDLDRVLRW